MCAQHIRDHLRSGLLTLPVELITTAASYLSTLELTRTLAVSRQWHALMTTSPSLWQRVLVNFTVFPPAPLQSLVAYSQERPLELSLLRINEPHVPMVLEVLNANMHRVRFLKLWFDDAEGWEDTEPFLAALDMPAPALRVLQLGSQVGNEYTWLPKDLFAGHAPVLRHVTLDLVFWFDAPCVAFGGITSLCANPEGWSVHEIMLMFPTLEKIYFCGSWSPCLPDPDNVRPADAAYWHGLPTLGLAVSVDSPTGEPAQEVIAFACSAVQHGVRHLTVRADLSHGLIARELLNASLSMSALCISRGGPDFGLEWMRPTDIKGGPGVYIEVTDADGRVVIVGDSERLARPESLCGDDDMDASAEDDDGVEPADQEERVSPVGEVVLADESELGSAESEADAESVSASDGEAEDQSQSECQGEGEDEDEDEDGGEDEAESQSHGSGEDDHSVVDLGDDFGRHPAGIMLRNLDIARCADISSFTLCESLFCYCDWYLAPLELPHLELLTILIVPLRQRRSTALFDCVLDLQLDSDMDGSAFINAPNLSVLRLACHPVIPAWTVGYVVGEWQEEPVVEEPREVTASSLSEFIWNRLVFNHSRLCEIVLEGGVVFSEGFCSDEADEVRKLTDDLRYDC